MQRLSRIQEQVGAPTAPCSHEGRSKVPLADVGTSGGRGRCWSGASILFVSDHEGPDAARLFATDSDGAAVQIIADFGAGSNVNWPSWSPDGALILCTVYSEGGSARAFVMCADGSDRRAVPDATGCGPSQDTPCWGPDSRTVAYTTELAEDHQPSAAIRSAIAVVRLDGSGSRVLHDPAVGLRYQQWSPTDPPRFALELASGQAGATTPPDIYTICARSGGERRQLTRGGAAGAELNEWPAWSRDGQQIVWARGDAATEVKNLWAMRAVDGGGAKQLTNGVKLGDGGLAVATVALRSQ
jgi:Tol biopolymer transport system component